MKKLFAVSDAIDAAIKDGFEMSIADSKVKYEQYRLSQANRERLPKIDAYGDYGQSGYNRTNMPIVPHRLP